MPKLNGDGMRRKNEKKKKKNPKLLTNMVNWYLVPWKSTQFHLFSSYTLTLWIGKGIVMSAFPLHNSRGPKCTYIKLSLHNNNNNCNYKLTQKKILGFFDGKISCLKMAKRIAPCKMSWKYTMLIHRNHYG
jgi:hypothetical protein